jgi:eukaryotic-like serine/threonine-protein kinase
MSVTPGERLGPYEITAALGAGGMGEVYRATDTRLGRSVALKLLPEAVAAEPERLARFAREAKLLASLSHPNVATLFGLEELSGRRVLVMELAEGEDLAERLKRGPLPMDEAIAVARQIAEALEEAHEKGIVHRDLKPANVKLTPDGKVKVLDFGLAKAWSPGDDGRSGSEPALSQSPTLARTSTEAGLILGTAAYMSPEQARGKAVDRRSDVWSFAVTLYELLTGERLFAGETVSDTLAAVLKTDVDWTRLPAGTPPAVRRLLERCLERDVRRRLQAIGEARIALEAGAAADASPRVEALGARRALRLLPWLLTAAALAAAAWALVTRGAPANDTKQVLQLEVVFPGEVEPVPSLESGFSISPDGRFVAITGVKGGARRILVRPLDGTEAIESSESGVNGSAFSPDSRKIVFLTSGHVIELSLADRQKRIITTSADLSGSIAWGETGIVFARDGALWLATAEGGEPRPLTTLAKTRREVLHSGQIVLPGGRTVLFASLSAEPGADRIEAVEIESGARHVVVERATTPVWSPTGHLLFAREGAVLATAFDVATALTRGDAIPVIPAGVLGTSASGSLGLRLAANGTLLYLPQDFHSKRVVSVARDGSALVLDLPRARYTNPRISPDGRRVMVDMGGNHLEALNLERGTHSRLTTEAPGTNFGIWNSDGSRVVYRRFNWPFWVAADGSGNEGEVKGAVANDYPSAPGPDPDSIFVTRIQSKTAGDVFLMSTSGAFEPRPLLYTRAYEGGAQLSPDGRWLVYVSNESGASEIYVRRYPALDRQWQVSEGGGIQPRWSASGREIYHRGGPKVTAVAFDGRSDVPVLGKPMPLFNDDYDLGQGITIANYDVTPEGRFVMLRRDAQGGQLHLVLNWTEELKRIIARGGAR